MYSKLYLCFTLQKMASYADLYPERRGGHVNPSVFQRATGSGHPNSLKIKCDRNIVWNIENMPMVQTMVSALKVNLSTGIEIYENEITYRLLAVP